MAIKRESQTHEILSGYWLGVFCQPISFYVFILFILSVEILATVIWFTGITIVYLIFKSLVEKVYRNQSNYIKIKEVYGKGVEWFVGAIVGFFSSLGWFFAALETIVE